MFGGNRSRFEKLTKVHFETTMPNAMHGMGAFFFVFHEARY
jgi:hypothetical protein